MDSKTVVEKREKGHYGSSSSDGVVRASVDFEPLRGTSTVAVETDPVPRPLGHNRKRQKPFLGRRTVPPPNDVNCDARGAGKVEETLAGGPEFVVEIATFAYEFGAHSSAHDSSPPHRSRDNVRFSRKHFEVSEVPRRNARVDTTEKYV